jgi:hypothetical protein
VKTFVSENLTRRGANALEMLIAVAVIAVIASVVIPQVTRSGSSDDAPTTMAVADSSKDRANAQNIVSMWSAVAATGGSQLPTTKEGCIDALLNGIDVPFAGGSNHYQLSGMAREDVTAASRYIGFSSGGVPRLIYLPEGGQ